MEGYTCTTVQAWSGSLKTKGGEVGEANPFFLVGVAGVRGKLSLMKETLRLFFFCKSRNLREAG